MKKRPLLELLLLAHPLQKKKELIAKIMCGEVFADGERLRDPKALVRPDANILLVEPKRFVSRGGDKLAHALGAFGVAVVGKTFIDAGASTGGFTDCLLSTGATLVYAVDVGYCQLDWRLRNDPRVVVMEKTNITACALGKFPFQPDIAVMDLSFRSIVGAARHCLSLVSEKQVISLVKPQFEWRRPEPEFQGIIRDPALHEQILLELAGNLQDEGVFVSDVTASPILGRKGNREFFFLLTDRQDLSAEERAGRIAGAVKST